MPNRKQFDISELLQSSKSTQLPITYQILPQPPSIAETQRQTLKQTSENNLANFINNCASRPFWIWDKAKHQAAQIDQRLHGHPCCFTHAIGRPRKNEQELDIFDYEQEIHDALLRHRRIWVKKATGLGITELILRIILWMALAKPSSMRDSYVCIVTGPRIELAISLIKRLKLILQTANIQPVDATKETVIDINRVRIEAFPSHHLDAMRGLDKVSFIFLDEADFFPKNQQQDARDVSERYIGKSNAYIAMVSTPNQPGGLFENIEQEKDELSLYYKIVLGYQRGLGNIYTTEDIVQAKRSPSFEREYNLKYLGSIGNVFATEDINAATAQDYQVIEYLDDIRNPPYIQGVMGLDPGWGVSEFGIVVTHFIDGRVRVAYVNQHSRQDHSEMLSVVWDLIQIYNVTKVLVDASAPSFIRALKLQWGERSDYENVDRKQREYMKVEPVAFGMEHKALLYHVKFMLENHYVQIHPTQDKLITALRSAWAKDGVLDKEITSYDDILDAFRLCLRPYKEQTAVT